MRVVVLMSTYNGERFILEQLRSIIEQLPGDGRILIRDDGSTDQTVASIRTLVEPRISVVSGTNIGFARSFLELMSAAPPDADMYMLSDQDDVWLPTKIQRAWAYLEGYREVPALYCSRLLLVDENLREKQPSILWQRLPSFANALTENIVTGCTAAFNLPALKLAKMSGNPDLIYFHDWWLYLVISAFGTVVFDPVPSILYRQHGHNVIGMSAGFQRYVNILKFLRKVDWIHIMFNQIGNFRTVHGASLNVEQRQFLHRYFEPQRATSMARLLLTPQRLRQSLLGDFLFRALLFSTLSVNAIHHRAPLPPT